MTGAGGTVAAADRRLLALELGRAFAAHLDLDELLSLVMTRCREVFDAEGAAVVLIDPASGEFYFPVAAERDPEAAARLLRARFPAGAGIAGRAVREGRPVRADDVSGDPDFYPGVDQITGLRTRSLLTAPLRGRTETLGVLQVLNPRDGRAFSDDDLAFLDAIAASVVVAIENAQRFRRVKTSEERLRAQVAALRRDLVSRDRFAEIVGATPAMNDVFRLMESAAPSSIAVLLEGETGTGKELVARAIHRAGERAEGPFVAVNCAALPEALLESELFGHRRGAFTGALADRTGLFEAADGGTIFLDEIGDMPVSMQARLLRVLQEGEVVPVGDTRPRRVDVRVVSATNRDVGADAESGRFRLDLYYRLAAFPIRLPALRERREDIPLLASHFLNAAVERHRKRVIGIDSAAMDALLVFSWPGNVRELQNEIERAVALASDGEAITTEHLSRKLTVSPRAEEGTDAERGRAPRRDQGRHEPAQPRESLRRARAAFEAEYIREALGASGGNVSRAARALGLSRVVLHKKIKEYGIKTGEKL